MAESCVILIPFCIDRIGQPTKKAKTSDEHWMPRLFGNAFPKLSEIDVLELRAAQLENRRAAEKPSLESVPSKSSASSAARRSFPCVTIGGRVPAVFLIGNGEASL